jgi:Skp family chaperone for outer membrane proteins
VQRSKSSRKPRHVLSLVLGLVFVTAASASPQQNGGTELSSQVDQLRSELTATKSQLTTAQEQIQQMRAELDEMKALMQGGGKTQAPAQAAQGESFPTLANAIKESKPESTTSEDQQVLAARVEELAQTKVETTSKYRVKLSGLILMNAYTNSGNVDISDLPNLAFPRAPSTPGGDLGATLRQSQIGLDVVGPRLAGATTGASVQADFFGGFPDANYGETYGLVRLRLATAYMNWSHTKLVAGQDSLFFSPQNPTSYATVGEPALAWAGNLWVWTPQIRVEHRWDVSDNTNFTAQFGILDSLTEQEPPDYFDRTPTPGEQSRVPAFGWHGGWNSKLGGRDATVGVGGYYGRQAYSFNRNVDVWSVNADYNLPLGPHLAWSGEVFRGRALGGLGGGIWNSIVSNGDASLAATQIKGLNDIGGWSQLKLMPAPKLEFNVAAGTDNPLSSDLLRFSNPMGTYFSPLARNQAVFANSIYRPRTNLLFALEYRHLRTYSLQSKSSADHVNLAIGVSF